MGCRGSTAFTHANCVLMVPLAGTTLLLEGCHNLRYCSCELPGFKNKFLIIRCNDPEHAAIEEDLLHMVLSKEVNDTLFIPQLVKGWPFMNDIALMFNNLLGEDLVRGKELLKLGVQELHALDVSC